MQRLHFTQRRRVGQRRFVDTDRGSEIPPQFRVRRDRVFFLVQVFDHDLAKVGRGAMQQALQVFGKGTHLLVVLRGIHLQCRTAQFPRLPVPVEGVLQQAPLGNRFLEARKQIAFGHFPVSLPSAFPATARRGLPSAAVVHATQMRVKEGTQPERVRMDQGAPCCVPIGCPQAGRLRLSGFRSHKRKSTVAQFDSVYPGINASNLSRH